MKIKRTILTKKKEEEIPIYVFGVLSLCFSFAFKIIKKIARK
jgi:hypothetical protein